MEKDQEQPIYLHVYPFRAVKPYAHVYTTFAKGRWLNKPLLQTLVRQFKAYDQKYYENTIIQGQIKINNKKVDTNYIIKNGDKLVHSTIRTQPPVLDLDIQLIQQNQEYVVVNKPPSLTVHTGGGFHYNTLISIMEHQLNYKGLYVLHRLDRLTSGLIIFSKNKQKPKIFHKQNLQQTMKKMYYARVDGNFKWEQKTLCASIQCVSFKDGIYKVHTEYPNIEKTKNSQNSQQLKKTQQMVQKQMKLKKQQQNKYEAKNQDINEKQMNKLQQQEKENSIKQSKTLFKKIWYDQKTNSSLLQCYPISGRTHQIRVHLQHLGYPILNDVVYGGRFIGNFVIKNVNKKIFKDINISQELLCQTQKQKQEFKKTDKKIKKEKQQNIEQSAVGFKQQKQNSSQFKKQRQKNISQHKKQLQKNTGINQKQPYVFQIKEWDYETRPWQICLHSYQYKLEDYTFRTKKPYWFYKNYIQNNEGQQTNQEIKKKE